MIPEPDHMITFTKAAMQQAGTRTWDDDPALLGIVLRMNIDLLDDMPIDGMYALAPFPVQPHDIGPDPGLALQAMAQYVNGRGGHDAPQMPPGLGQLCGIVLISEAWMNSDPDVAVDRPIADIVGTVEARTVIVIDCGGRYYWAQQIRGKAPTVEQWDDPAQASGRVPEALRDILLSMHSGTPGEMDVEAVRRVATFRPVT